MKKISVFIDGFNLYHSLDKNPKYHQYKWLNLHNLAKCFMQKTEELVAVYYFTALAYWNPQKVVRHKAFIKSLQIKGVKPIYGKFKRVERLCLNSVCKLPRKKKTYKTHEEKRTDVNIAIYMLEKAVAEEYDIALLITGDSDIIPAIESIKRLAPSKEIRLVPPIGQACYEIKDFADQVMKMKEKHLKTSLLEKEISITGGKKLVSPKEWFPKSV